MVVRSPDMINVSNVTRWNAETIRIVARLPEKGIFLTGVEASDPYVDGVRRNQLQEAHDFYRHYAERLKRIRELGITWLRFGVPYSQVHVGRDAYDFAFFDKVMQECDALGITVVADLLHFGLPDWLHQENAEQPYFQNGYFPIEFAKYAHEFAMRYPQINNYTLVNEPFVTAYLSAKLGMWNEQRSSSWEDDRDFLNAAINIAQASVLGREAIEKVWQTEKRSAELFFVQNESFELAITEPGSGREAEVERFNLRRFVLLDLIFGHRDETMRRYLVSQGVSELVYEWFMSHGRRDKTILGIDHYPWCVHEYTKEKVIEHTSRDPYRLFELTQEYWNRYPLPLLHTEVNAWPEDAITICQKTYDALSEMRHKGYPILGMAWYGDDLQVGWHVAMKGPESFKENPVGLLYRGKKQPIATTFAKLAKKGLPQFK